MKYLFRKSLLCTCISFLLTTPLFANDTITLSSGYKFGLCTVDVTNKTGLDISDYYNNFSNPFAFHTNPKYPGVTLPGPERQARCDWTTGKPKKGQTQFTWNKQKEQCILNGNYGYFPTKGSCSTGEPSKMSKADLLLWKKEAESGRLVYLKGIPGTTTDTPVMIAYGHGVLNSPCGGVTLVKNTAHGATNYAVVLEVGARAWSYEISSPASGHLAADNFGGTCYIPAVFQLNDSDVQKITHQL